MDGTEESSCRDRYLELLKKSLSGTLFRGEPDADHPNVDLFAARFIEHYIKGQAVTMLPLCRLEHLRSSVETVLRDDVPGDLIETGVWRGGATIFMRALLEACGDRHRRVWVADSFEGLPKPDARRFPKEAAQYHGPTIQKGYNRLAVTLEEVRANFAAYDLLDERVCFLKGWFNASLPKAPIDKLALMRLDGDYYESTMDALTSLYDKLSIGGIVIVDDYGEHTWTNCREAVDDFRKTRGISDQMTAVDSRCYWWRRTAAA